MPPVPIADSQETWRQGRIDSLLRHDTPVIIDSTDTTLTEIVPTVIGGDTLGIITEIPRDSLARDTSKKKRQPLFGEIIHTKNRDSMVYDVVNGRLYLYQSAEAKYGRNVLNADYMDIEIARNQINAQGVIDTASKELTRVKFDEGGTIYEMDSMSYNLKSKKAIIQGVYFTEGDGIIHGQKIKKMEDDVMNIKGAKYTTCDLPNPHFYLSASKAQLIQTKNSKQIVVGPSFLVIEDVPLPLAVPFGFFPVMQNRRSGIIMPEFGEETRRGFFLRRGGYYWAVNDYFDLAIRGGIYTMGSWEANVASSYRVNYKFNGKLDFSYANDVIGMPDDADYSQTKQYKVRWTHTQDPKFLPSSTFSASVDLSSSSYDKYNGSVQDMVNAQTNSSIAFSKSWVGTPFSLSANIQHSQNNRDSTVTMSLPNVVLTMNRIYPFQRRNAVGKKRWYEKVSLSYTGTLNNRINTTTTDFMTSKMFDNMKYGVKHAIPVNTSFNILKYLNVSPSVNYNETWYFNRIVKEWSPEQNAAVVTDTTKGFYRMYDYSASMSFSTVLYGMYTFNPKSKVSAVRHVMTPSVSASYRPDFSDTKYGFYRPVQKNAAGDIDYYSPYEQGIFGGPTKGQSASLSLSLNNNIEMKVRTDKDTTGFKKIKILESLNFSTSYNFLADSMNLAPISISARTTLFKGLGINLTGSLDPYIYDGNNRRTKEFAWSNGSAGRLTSVSLSFGYSLRSFFGAEGPGSGTGSETLPRNLTSQEQQDLHNLGIDPELARQTLMPEYYNFSVPWNFSFNYNLAYSNASGAAAPKVTQTLSFNGSVNLTPKWGLSFSSGLDMEKWQLTTTSINITRDLHCWQMGFSWVPLGFRKSWSFNINVKSSVLQDLKFKKSSDFLDNTL